MQATIIRTIQLTSTIAQLLLQVPASYPTPLPGQFVRIACNDPLPRPFGVSWYDSHESTPQLAIVVENRGPGTKWLLDRPSYTRLEISTPLGRGFALNVAKSRFLIVGGGVGVAPLLSIFSSFRRDYVISADALLGFKTSSQRILQNQFIRETTKTIIATDDGNYGMHARADELLRSHLATYTGDPYVQILTCGPRPMLKAVAEIAKEHNIPCQVLLEEYMACGVGACGGCPITLTSGERVPICTSGPMFYGEEVDWNV